MPEGIHVNTLAPRIKGVHPDDTRPVPAEHGGTGDLNRPELVARPSAQSSTPRRRRATSRRGGDTGTSLDLGRYGDIARSRRDLGDPGRFVACLLRRFGHPIRPVRRPRSPRDGPGPLLASAPRRSAGDPARTETGRRRIGESGSNPTLPPAGVARPDRLAPFTTVGRRRRPAGSAPRAHGPGPTEPIRSGRGFHPVERDADGRDPTGARRRRPRPDRHHPRAIGERARVARLPVELAERLLVWCFSPGSGRGLCPFCCVASRPTSGRYSGVSSRRQTPGRRSYSRAGRFLPSR